VKTLFTILLIISAISLSGCTWKTCETFGVKPKEVVIDKIVYIKQPIPEIPNKPDVLDYKFNIIELNGNDYYILDKPSASRLSINWNSYKGWAEANYMILLELTDINNTKNGE
jgi:hypothetical protein